MSLANYVSIVLMLGLFGGVIFFLVRRRSRVTKIAVGTPAVLQPRPDAPTGSLPSTLNKSSQDSWFQKQPGSSDRRRDDDLNAAPPDRPAPDISPAPKKSAESAIVELHFMPDQPPGESSPRTTPPLSGSVTEADVLEEKKDLPASA